MKKPPKIIRPIIFAVLLIFLGSCEQNEDLLDPLESDYWLTYNQSNSGIPGNQVRDIYTDSNGKMWFACYGNGIACFDGQKWTTYNSSNSPLNNNVKTILEDMDGDMWFGTTDGIYFLIDNSNWEYYPGEDVTPMDVNKIFMDSDDDIWIGTEGSGFYLYSGEYIYGPIQFEENEGLNVVNDINEDAQGYTWIATDYAALKFNNEFWEITRYNEEYPPIEVIYSDSKDRLWIAADGGSTVIYYEAGVFNNLTLLNGQPNYFVRGIGEDGDGNLWFATFMDGIIKYDGTVMTSFKPYNGFPSEYNYCLESDNMGNIWVGTMEHGALKYIPSVEF